MLSLLMCLSTQIRYFSACLFMNESDFLFMIFCYDFVLWFYRTLPGPGAV